MSINRSVLQSPQFIITEGAIVVFALCTLSLVANGWLLGGFIFAIGTVMSYFFIEQQRKINALQSELQQLHHREDAFALRTEQIRRTLHDIRSPMSALRLRIQILQKTSCEPDQRHLARLESSLETAIEQLATLSDIQKGQIDPTESMILNISLIREHLSQ